MVWVILGLFWPFPHTSPLYLPTGSGHDVVQNLGLRGQGWKMPPLAVMQLGNLVQWENTGNHLEGGRMGSQDYDGWKGCEITSEQSLGWKIVPDIH